MASKKRRKQPGTGEEPALASPTDGEQRVPEAEATSAPKAAKKSSEKAATKKKAAKKKRKILPNLDGGSSPL